MKGVTDLYISKDKLAIFWFLVCVGMIATTAWYSTKVLADGRGRMQYVIINRPDTTYIDKTLEAESLTELIDYQTRQALETLLNRGPNGPLTPARVGKIFYGEGLDGVLTDVTKSSYDFRTRQVHQLCEVGQVIFDFRSDGTAYTSSTGQLIRVGVDPVGPQAFNQVLTFRAEMLWEPNKNLRESKLFPFVCTRVSYAVIVVSNS